MIVKNSTMPSEQTGIEPFIILGNRIKSILAIDLGFATLSDGV
jgi:hypothetical protein